MQNVSGLTFTREVSKPGQARIRIDADLQDTLLFEFYQSFLALDFTYLRRCSEWHKELFADYGNQDFCTSLCANRARKGRYRLKK